MGWDWLDDVGDTIKDHIPMIGGGPPGRPPQKTETFSEKVVMGGLEPTLQGMRWLYSNGVAQPISTVALVGAMNRQEFGDVGQLGHLFDADNWAKSWHAANHISPGQAIVMSDDDRLKAINSPLTYYKPPDAYLPEGFDELEFSEQQKLLREAGLPAVGNRFIEQKRGDSSWFKYGTGAVDFASVVFLDPTIVGGKLAFGIKAARYTVPRPKGGWSPEQIDKIVQRSNVQKAIDDLFTNRENAHLVSNTKMAERSGMGGPRFAAVNAQLQSRDETELFVRIGMGDGRAIDELTQRNAMAAERLANDQRRLGALDLNLASTRNETTRFMVQAEMQRLEDAKNADVLLMNRYQEVLKNKELLDQLNVSRDVMFRAQMKTRAQQRYEIGPSRRTVIDREQGLVKTTLVGASDYFSGPVTLVRMLKNGHPNGHMRIDQVDNDSIVELRGFLARIPNIKPETRGKILSAYMKTQTEAERIDLLDNVGRMGSAKVAAKYGIDPEYGNALYQERLLKMLNEKQRMQVRMREDERFTAATDPDRMNAAGQPLHIDEFSVGGNKTVVEPFTVTRLANSHVLPDLDEMAKIYFRHGDGIKAAIAMHGTMKDALAATADYTSYLWKFFTLFRLGYIPRVLSDDLGGQVGRLGAVTMVARAGLGVKNGVTNAGMWLAKPRLNTKKAVHQEELKYIDDELSALNPQRMALAGKVAGQRASNERDLALARRRVVAAEAHLAGLGPEATTAQRGAAQKLVEKRASEHTLAEKRLTTGAAGKNIRLQSLQQEAAHLERYRDFAMRSIEDIDLRMQKVIQGNQHVEIDGVMFPPAFNDYYKAMVSADESVGNIFNTAKQLSQGHLERTFDHGAKPISATQDEVAHAQAWARAINFQIMQDPLQARFVRSSTFTVEDAVRWMTQDPRGIAYRRRLPKMIQTEDIARAQKLEVDQYMHIPEIRLKALEGPVSPEFLKRVAPHAWDRPDVHIAQMGMASLRYTNLVDRNIQRWFNFAATLPANRMSRHPLFNQQYEGHLKILTAQRKLHGRPVTVAEVDDVADTARQLALRDTRRLVFDIAHRSDAAAALRFMSPFFSATQEAFIRWGRIIADRPQVLGYAQTWYNMPLQTSGMNVLGFRFGGMQNQDGMPLTHDGKYLDPETGTMKTARKSDRFIITRTPSWFANSPLGKAMNMTKADGTVLLSQNSMNLVTQGDPWFNPGVGPIVAIPVNEWVKDKPKDAEIARHLGILPFGPRTGRIHQRVADQVLPGSIRNFITAWDTSDSRYQMIKLQITNQAIYEHENLGKKMLTPQEIANRTRQYWLFSASASFLQPMATQRKDPYQFFYDQYNALRRKDPKTADAEYLRRYGESHFIFATSMSKTLSGVPPTMKGYELGKKYEKFIRKYPELGALAIGPEGNGPFSPEVYAYQLNHPLEPGGAEMERKRLNADEVVTENRKRLGWSKYVARMNQLTAKLHERGLLSFEEAGAEDLLADKRAYTKLYSEPLMPDGSENKYYIKEWAEDFKSKDPDHYDKLIPGLTELARSEQADQPHRTDLRVLRKYLGGRQGVLEELEKRRAAGQPHTLEAMANRDLRFRWIYFVDGLVESDTRFGDLYNRYLGRDLGVDVESESEVVQLLEEVE